MPALSLIVAFASPVVGAMPHRPPITLATMFANAVLPVKAIMLGLIMATIATVIICVIKLIRGDRSEGSAFIANMRLGGPVAGLAGMAYGLCNSMVGVAMSGTTNIASVAPGLSEAFLSLFLGLWAGTVAIIAYTFVSGLSGSSRIKA